MELKVKKIALEMVGEIRGVLPTIRRMDRSLADQLQRAASSVVLNIAEGEYSNSGHARSRFHTAAGSNHETRAALELAVAWGHIPSERVEPALELGDRVQAMLYRLTRS
jgi:four helix bundle protein